MIERLIVLGAGATAALSEKFPVGKNFFSSNPIWKSKISDYPHLALALRKVNAFDDGSDDSKELTRVWLFLDTLLKYHLAVRWKDEYNYALLRARYKNDKARPVELPPYLSMDYLNAKYDELCWGMTPLFSTLQKQIYYSSRIFDPVSYFLSIAGWELKHLMYRTYPPRIKNDGRNRDDNLYTSLLKSLKKAKQLGKLAFISFNYDIFFEMACRTVGIDLGLSGDTARRQSGISFCKPHGGWNIRHLNERIEPFADLAKFVEEKHFDMKQGEEERPAMIPYFSYPDEFKQLHQSRFPGVGQFFIDQQYRMKQFLRTAKAIVSIGYSFTDAHTQKIVKEISSGKNRRRKRLLHVTKPGSEKIAKVFGLKDKEVETCEDGFCDQTIARVVKFFNAKK